MLLLFLTLKCLTHRWPPQEPKVKFLGRQSENAVRRDYAEFQAAERDGLLLVVSKSSTIHATIGA